MQHPWEWVDSREPCLALGLITYAEKTVSLANTYKSDGQTSYTFHSPGETRLFTHQIESNSINVLHDTVQPLLGETIRRLKDDLKHTADQLTTYLEYLTSPNPPQSQNTFLLL